MSMKRFHEDVGSRVRVLAGAPPEETGKMSPGNLIGQYVRVATQDHRNSCGINGKVEIVGGKYRVVHCPPGYENKSDEIKKIAGVGKTVVFDDDDIFNYSQFREEDGRRVVRIDLYRGPRAT